MSLPYLHFGMISGPALPLCAPKTTQLIKAITESEYLEELIVHELCVQLRALHTGM
jgi:hypothetical protein